MLTDECWTDVLVSYCEQVSRKPLFSGYRDVSRLTEQQVIGLRRLELDPRKWMYSEKYLSHPIHERQIMLPLRRVPITTNTTSPYSMLACPTRIKCVHPKLAWTFVYKNTIVDEVPKHRMMDQSCT